jgi:hypothetical protein
MNQASPTRSPWLARGALFAAFATLLATAPFAAQANPRHHGERAQACQSCGTVISTRTYQQAGSGSAASPKPAPAAGITANTSKWSTAG